ncbi:MAG: nopaline transport system permease protein NocM [Alphaproteobacteria bacterium]|jgi:octopine/nopaline transport system permease protein|nr:MAG: nopaline transport system permease protein NocM [Alphaproteobacteria bacterium]|tara:strand:- start:653 stop:1363 length:711 start_codon:yes stop_codon:yes gene_type:complete
MIEFLNSIQNSLIYKNFFLVLSGLDNTILLLLISLPLGFVLALLFALGRVSKITLLSRTIASYIFVIRGTPLLVQIYLIYFGLGSVKFIRESFLWYALKEPFWCGVIALTINTVAYGAEIFRGGIQSIEKSQVESGLSLGFGKFLLLRKIILPIAIRKVLPSYGNELILMVKATSLVSLTTYMEMTGIARKIMAKTFAPVEAFIAAGILYLFLNFLMVQFVKYLEWKYNPHLRLNN